jgi:hypothetical protein
MEIRPDLGWFGNAVERRSIAPTWLDQTRRVFLRVGGLSLLRGSIHGRRVDAVVGLELLYLFGKPNSVSQRFTR